MSPEITWIPCGYEIRCPFDGHSSWTAGDINFSDITKTYYKMARKRPNRIVSFDMNICPRPVDIESLEFDYAQPKVEFWSSPAIAKEKCVGGTEGRKGVLLFYEMSLSVLNRLKEERWFGHLPSDIEKFAASGMQHLGFDLIDDRAISVLWDITEPPWLRVPSLVNQIGVNGLLSEPDQLAAVLAELPLASESKWVAPFKVSQASF